MLAAVSAERSKPGGPEQPAAEEGSTLAAKLDRLFRTMHPRDRGEYGYAEVAEAIRASGGPTISAMYLWQLRHGVRDNPTKRHLEALASFFGVPPGYFFDGQVAARVEAELELLRAMRDAAVHQMALRAWGLSPKAISAITEMIESARRFEGLPDPPGHGHREPSAPGLEAPRRRGRPRRAGGRT
jgi:transcriptional regulator with XRE-family HTH domain